MSLRTNQRMLFLVLGVLAIACTTLHVDNSSDRDLRIQVTMPDGEGPVIKKLIPYGDVQFISESGGNFEVAVLPSEDYINFLKLAGVDLSFRLWGAAEAANRTEMAVLIDEITDLNQKINDLTQNYERCLRNVPQDETQRVEVFWNEGDSKPTINCNTRDIEQ